MRVLVLSGSGFIGRHVVAALIEAGHEVVVGTRNPSRVARKLPPATRDCERRAVRFEQMTLPNHWDRVLENIDVVVNCVGILRERWAEKYEVVHHLAPAVLTKACASLGVTRLIHVSALGLHAGARSGFLISKLRGERAIQSSALDWTIVRPSLLDGEDGFGALWLRRMARWPVHFVPADAVGRLAAFNVADLGEAIAALCETTGRSDLREVELGGSEVVTMRELLAALRRAFGYPPATCLSVPVWLALLASRICDLLHFSPFSFGHLELLRRDNVARHSLLPQLLKHPPRSLGMRDYGDGTRAWTGAKVISSKATSPSATGTPGACSPAKS